MPTLRLSAIALILANFVPVFGVLYWGWSVGSIIALYWAENWVIGALNLPKMWMAKEGSRKSSFPLSLFFAVHYGFFTAIHGVFVFSLFGEGMAVFDLLPGGPLFLTLLILACSHTLSFIVNYWAGGEYKTRTVQKQMFRPYGRIVVLHIVILAGGILVQSMGSPMPALLVLIGIKTVIDMLAHIKSHKMSNTDSVPAGG